jgi:hypothetical protein
MAEISCGGFSPPYPHSGDFIKKSLYSRCGISRGEGVKVFENTRVFLTLQIIEKGLVASKVSEINEKSDPTDFSLS